MISTVLCVQFKSNYYQVGGLDLWDINRDAYNFSGSNSVIAHPPCAQWSRLRSFAKTDQRQKDLAIHCYEVVKNNGGILEHPMGSLLWRSVGLSAGRLISVDQSWFGFPARKRTLLWFVGYVPGSHPISFDCVTGCVQNMSSAARSLMPLSMCLWLLRSDRAIGLSNPPSRNNDTELI